jgi:membrane peptidoglycan carboxypeptidase
LRARGSSHPDGYEDTPERTPRPRRSMAEMARDASRSMSRQLSAVMSRTGQALRGGGPGGPGGPDGTSARLDVPPRRPISLPPEVTEKLNAQPYRRSRARMLARKWRISRTPPNPLIYFGVIVLCTLVAILGAFGGGVGGVYAYNYYQGHVDQIQAIANLKYHASSQILDRNGQVLATIKDDSGFNYYVPLSQISPKLQWATIDMEDHTFYDNIGIDFFATVRALYIDALHGGAADQGASTITQQLVKNIVAKDSTKTVTRKINEAILAYGVTQQYDKAQILEMYLNTISYGDSNTGSEAAAKNFFGINDQRAQDGSTITASMQLDWAQAALLAGLPNAPTIYLPIQYSCSKIPCQQSQWDYPYAGLPCGSYIDSFGPEWYLTHGHEWLDYCRARQVLDSVRSYGVADGTTSLSSADYDHAVAELTDMLVNQKIYHWKGVSPTTAAQSTADNLAPHFVQYVVDDLATNYGLTDLGSAGLRVYTTLDYNLQKYAAQDLDYYINQPHVNLWYPSGGCGPGAALDCPLSGPGAEGNAHNGAVIAIDQHTGDIMAMVGSVNPASKDPLIAGAVNLTTSPRSMGSATKPLVYATAFQMGWDPSVVLQDQPICFPDTIPNDPVTHKPVVDPSAPACAGYYVPHNYSALDFSGRYPIRYMLGNSLNIAATETLNFVGDTPATADAFLSMAQRLGVTSLKKGDMGPTTALGTQDISLMQLTGAYGVFANGGKRVAPRSILRIETLTGQQVYPVPPGPAVAPPDAGQQVLSPQVAYEMTSILTDNVARAADFGYAKNPLHFGPPSNSNDNWPNLQIAAKTGTSSGANGPQDIVTVGYSPYLSLGVWMGNSNGKEMYQYIIGIAGAGYVFHDVMKWAVQNYHWPTDAQFQIPPMMARGQFNCTTGLAPYKDDKLSDCTFQPFDPKNSVNLYNHDTGELTHPNSDWYIQGQAPTSS